MPALDLRIVAMGSGLGLRVINVGTELVSLSPKVMIESGADGDAKESGLVLQNSCRSQGCVTLAQGAEIDAPAWLERVSGERCGSLLVPSRNGEHSLIVFTCDGAHRVRIPFTWPMQ